MNKALLPWLRHGAALGCAVFLLVGRWSPQRLGESFEALSFLPELRTIALFGLCVILAIVATQSPIRKPLTAFPKLIAAFLAWACLSYFWSINQEAAALKITDLLLLSGFMICFYQFALRFSKRTFICLFAKYYIALLAVLCFCAAFALDYSALGGIGLENRKVFAVGSGPNVFGRNMALLTIACLLALNYTKRTLVPILLAGIPLSFVLLSGSRGALFELLAGLALALVFMRRHFLIKIATPLLILLPLASTLLSGSDSSLARIVLDIQQNRLVTHTIETFHDSSRTELLVEAYQLGLAHPVVGAGLGGYKYVHNEEITLHYPHNLVAEAWSEFGAIGLILMFLLGGYFARAYLPRLKSTWGFISAGVITSGIFSMLSGDLYDARTLFCFALAWSLLYNTPHDEQDLGTRPSPSA
jgi:O-antigen ligase